MTATSKITDAELVTVAEPAVRMAAEQSGLPYDLTDAHDYIDSLLTLCLSLFVDGLNRATDPRDTAALTYMVKSLMRVALLS